MRLGCSKIIVIWTDSSRNLVLQQHFHPLDLIMLIVINCYLSRIVLSRSYTLVPKFNLLSLGFYFVLESLYVGVAGLKLLLLAIMNKYHLSHLLRFLVITLQVSWSKDLGYLLDLSETVLETYRIIFQFGMGLMWTKDLDLLVNDVFILIF